MRDNSFPNSNASGQKKSNRARLSIINLGACRWPDDVTPADTKQLMVDESASVYSETALKLLWKCSGNALEMHWRSIRVWNWRNSADWIIRLFLISFYISVYSFFFSSIFLSSFFEVELRFELWRRRDIDGTTHFLPAGASSLAALPELEAKRLRGWVAAPWGWPSVEEVSQLGQRSTSTLDTVSFRLLKRINGGHFQVLFPIWLRWGNSALTALLLLWNCSEGAVWGGGGAELIAIKRWLVQSSLIHLETSRNASVNFDWAERVYWGCREADGNMIQCSNESNKNDKLTLK